MHRASGLKGAEDTHIPKETGIRWGRNKALSEGPWRQGTFSSVLRPFWAVGSCLPLAPRGSCRPVAAINNEDWDEYKRPMVGLSTAGCPVWGIEVQEGASGSRGRHGRVVYVEIMFLCRVMSYDLYTYISVLYAGRKKTQVKLVIQISVCISNYIAPEYCTLSD